MKKILLVKLLFVIFVGVAFAQAPQEKTATVFGAKIRYLEAGDPAKPTVVLLHGLGSNADGWVGLITALSPNYHVIAPDQIGFGKSDKPFLKYRIGTYADFLDKMLSDLKIEKASLVGSSMGGWVAGLYAARYPSRVEKVVLVNAAGLTPKEMDYAKVYQLSSSTREEVANNLSIALYDQSFSKNPAMIDFFLMQRVTAGDGYTIASIIESIKRNEDFLDKKLGDIKKPTLIIWGKQDRLIEVSDAERFNKGIAGSELVIFDKCGHVPALEVPALFNKAVMDFLEKK